MEVDVVSLAAEFPNDNPALHQGAIWTCATVTSAPTAEVQARAFAPAPAAAVPVPAESGFFARVDEPLEAFALEPGDDAAPPIIEELEPIDDDPFTLLVAALEEVARGAGVSGGLVARLFATGDLRDLPLPPEVEAALSEADLVRAGVATPGFIRASHGWRAILCGTSEDFDACGGKMLDEWSAELLARLLGTPSRAGHLRRDLRARGVAAFGLAA